MSGAPEMLVTDSTGLVHELYSRSDAILIGNINYSDPRWGPPLARISKQLDTLRGVLEAQGFHVIVYEDLTSSDMIAALDSFVRSYGYNRGARLLFYYAGHGVGRDDNEESGTRRVGYAISTDTPKLPAEPSDSETQAFLQKAVRFSQFKEWAEAMEARHVLFIFDCCFSGVILKQRGERQLVKGPDYIFKKTTRYPLRFFLTAGADETVPGDGPYTDLLIQTLDGTRRSACRSHDGFLTSKELDEFLETHMPDYSNQTPQGGPLRDVLFDQGDMIFQLPNDDGPSLGHEDELRSIVYGLESDDEGNKKDARLKLAKLLATAGPAFVSEVIDGMPQGSDRYRLGVASALAATPKWADTRLSRRVLLDTSAKTEDLTLKGVIGTALNNAAGKLVVGFSQGGAESGWRTANTESIKFEAEKRGIDLCFSKAQQKRENQIKAIQSFIAQGVDVIAFSPVVETGFEAVLEEAKRAGIPVVLSDGLVKVSDPSLYVTFLGPDFYEEGKRAANEVVKLTGGKGNIAMLGTVGSAAAIDRKKGFEEILAWYPNLKIIMSQSGDPTQAKGKEVMEIFLRSPQSKDINVLLAYNDDMALGAIQAIEEAGIKPGVDVKIVSIGGVKGEAMRDGKLNATVEGNPLLGPQLFDLVQKAANKEEVPKRVISQERVFERWGVAVELPKSGIEIQ